MASRYLHYVVHMFIYGLITSVVARMASGGNLLFSMMLMMWVLSLIYAGVLATRGLIMLFRKSDIFFVAPVHPLTIGLVSCVTFLRNIFSGF